MMLLSAGRTCAQDPFEIHVYEYESLKPGAFTVEGFMLLSAKRPGYGLDYAGWRLLPHFYVPEKWHWPLGVGLVDEFAFQRTTYEENSRRIEIRPILEKSFGRWQVDLNPVFERAIHGPGTRDGWNFEPAARLAYRANDRFTPSLEYYSETGPFPTELPVHEQNPSIPSRW